MLLYHKNYCGFHKTLRFQLLVVGSELLYKTTHSKKQSVLSCLALRIKLLLLIHLRLICLISHSSIGAYCGLRSIHKVKPLHNFDPILK